MLDLPDLFTASHIGLPVPVEDRVDTPIPMPVPKKDQVPLPTIFTDSIIDSRMPMHEVEHYVDIKPLTKREKLELAKASLKVQFPRIFKQIAMLWGSKECSKFFQELITMEEGKEHRQGFPPDILEGLLMLSMFHDEKFQITNESELSDMYQHSQYK